MLRNFKQQAVRLSRLAATFAKKAGAFGAKTVKNNLPAAVSLALSLTAVVITMVCSAGTVNIFDGENTYSVKGDASNIDGIIESLAITDRDYEIVGVTNNLFSTNVNIEYLVSLTIKVGENEDVYSVRKGNLGDILSDLGYELDENDTVSPSADTYVGEDTTAVITDVEYVTETETEAIPYGSDVVFSSSYDTNTTFSISGKAGVKTLTYSVKYVNGVAVETVLVGEEITEYAVDATTVYGTSAPKYAGGAATRADNVSCISTLNAPDDLLIDASGKPVSYSRKATLRATAYTHTGNNCSTGVYPQPGYVAVDPSEIPYGTKMYIVSADGKYVYGYAVAADTGGFIHGTRTDMDLFFNSESECVNFGRRDIIVYFLD